MSTELKTPMPDWLCRQLTRQEIVNDCQSIHAGVCEDQGLPPEKFCIPCACRWWWDQQDPLASL